MSHAANKKIVHAAKTLIEVDKIESVLNAVLYVFGFSFIPFLPNAIYVYNFILAIMYGRMVNGSVKQFLARTIQNFVRGWPPKLRCYIYCQVRDL